MKKLNKPLSYYKIEASFWHPSKRLIEVFLQNPNGGQPISIVHDTHSHRARPIEENWRVVEIKPQDW